MKKIDFTMEKQNGVDVIKYVLGAADVYDERVSDKATQMANIIPFQYQDVDGKRIYTAYAHEDITLDAYMKNVLTKPEVLGVLGGLAAIFEIGTKGIPVGYIVKDASYIYVNRENITVKAVLFPLKQENMPLSEIPAFFREIISNMKFHEADVDNYVARVITQINAPDFSAASFKAFIDQEMEKIGMFIHKDNGPMNMMVGGGQAPNKDVKVNKVGVMNNMNNMNNMRPMGMAPQGAPMPPQGMPMPPQGAKPQGAPMPQAPKPQMGMPGMPQAPAPQGAPKPQMGMPGMPQAPAPQGAPMPQAPKPQMGMPGMPGMPQAPAPQGAPMPQAPKPQMGMPGMPQAPAPQGAPMPQAPKPQMGIPGMPQAPAPQGAPMPQAPKPQMGMPGMPQAPAPQGAPMPQAPKPQMGMPGMSQAPAPQGAPMPQAPKPQMGMPGMPQAPAPQGAPMPQAPKPQMGMPGMPQTPAPQGAPMPQTPKPQMGMPGMPQAPAPQGAPMPQAPKPQMGMPGMPQAPAPQGAPMPQAPKPQMGMPGMSQAPAPQGAQMGTVPQGSPMGTVPQAAPVGQTTVQGQTVGNLVGKLGDKPVPHLVRKKTGETINITKPEFSLGKAIGKVDYAITDNTAVSRIHCIIVQKNGVNYIKDNGSTNHTYLDGAELEPQKEVLLKNKMTILLGDEEFTFLLRKGE